MVKFGKYLKENAIPEWRDHYMHYKVLKKLIGAIQMTECASEHQQFFISQLREDAQRVEKWYVEIQRRCMKRLQTVRDQLPQEMREKVSISQPLSLSRSSNPDDNLSVSKTPKHNKHRKIHKSSDDKKDSDRHSSSILKEKDDKKSSTEEEPKNKTSKKKSHHHQHHHDNKDRRYKRTQSNASQSTLSIGDSGEFSSSGMDDTIDDIPLNITELKSHPSTLLKLEDTEAPALPKDIASSPIQLGGTNEQKSHMLIDSGKQQRKESQEGDEEEEELGSTEEKEDGNDADDEDMEWDDLTWRSSKMYLNDEVYSHLPPPQYKSLVQIVKTLARLQLFGWQNAEGFRKTIKKFDKQCSCRLIVSFWPQIKLYEFAQQKRQSFNIEKCTRLLTPRTIPFGGFGIHYLRDKGINLQQVATSIQQLETIVDTKADELASIAVEPRSYMANERTFLKWTRLAALIVVIGLALITLEIQSFVGTIMILLAVALMLFAFYEYRVRNTAMVERMELEWVDKWTPKILVISILVPIATYLIIYGINRKIVTHSLPQNPIGK